MTQPTSRNLQRLLPRIFIILVLAAAIGAALYHGQTSPVIASGRVLLHPDLKEKAANIRRVFIIVRDANSPMPMPYGAMATTLSVPPTKEVLEFKLTPENLNVMNREGEQPKKITIKVRLDQDGQGGMDQPGDIVGLVEGVDWGATNLEITLDRVIPEPLTPGSP